MQEDSEMLAKEMPGEDGEILLLQRLTKGQLRKRGVVSVTWQLYAAWLHDRVREKPWTSRNAGAAGEARVAVVAVVGEQEHTLQGTAQKKEKGAATKCSKDCINEA